MKTARTTRLVMVDSMTYTFPNDDGDVGRKFGEAFKDGRALVLEDPKDGKVVWINPQHVLRIEVAP